MRIILLCILALAAPTALLCAQDTGSIRTADGFQCPVGPNGTGEGYYVARGYRPNGHLGEDWNGIRGGDTDLGDPIYSIANGLVVFAKNYHVGWGNVVIIRHAYYEGFALKYVDSLYGHLLSFNVQEGDHVKRGQQIGRLGSNSGMYDAHLHLEIRKNLQIGMYRSSFPRDFSNYHSPSQFIAAHRICDRGNRVARTPINTFPATAPPSYAAGAQVYTPVYAPGNAPRNPAITSEPVLAPARSTPEREPEPVVKTTLEPPPMPKPVPATPAPEKKVVVTKPTPTPAPVEKTTPKPKVVAATSTPAPRKTEEDTPAATASSKTTPKPKTVASSTPAPSKTTAKSTKSTPSATPKPTTTTAKAESTPAPKTASTSKATTPKPTAKTSSTPVPKTASTTKESTKASTATKPAPVAKEPAVTPTKATTTAAATFRSTVKPPPPAAPVEIDPVEPALPTNAAPPITTPGSPIRRAGSGFRVDRFPDMRGNGY